jgi:TatD DNase family protein
MLIIDTHTHLYLEQFDEDRTEVIESAIKEGVKYMFLPNIDAASFKGLKELQKLFPDNCFPMMGLHPTSVNDTYEYELKLVEDQLNTGDYIAVGEIGIDLYWDKTFREQQEDALKRQLRLAKKHQLPVAIHTRDSFEQVFKIVKSELTDDLKGVFHCFTGNLTEANMIMDIGFKMGIGGIVTFKNAGLAEVVRDIPVEHLLLETDAPYLTPVPFRGKRNESSYLTYIAEKIAGIKEISVEQVAEITTKNTFELFNRLNHI